MATKATTEPASERHGGTTGLLEQSSGMLEEARRLRRQLHTWPEIGLDLPKTREAVLQALEGLPLDMGKHYVVVP